MISRSELKKLIQQEPKFDDIMCSLQMGPKLPKAMIGETKKIVAIARKFNDEVVSPYVLELDSKMHEDPEFLPWDFVEQANKWGFYTMWIPKIFGGKGYNFPSLSYFLEEIGSVCLSMANLIGVHYLGFATLTATWHTPIIKKLCNDVAQGEKNGLPCLISLATTEPDAGTDVEEVELLDKGSVTCHAKRVNDGYLVNGSKVFISNGHISQWHILIAYSNLEKASENVVVLAVKSGIKGFSFGRQEHKMGQKGCPASELIFKDCFISDEYVCLDSNQLSKGKQKRSNKELYMQVLDTVLAVSRAGVGAFGTGAARGAFEQAAKFALETEVDGKLMINFEWVQCVLAEMYKNVIVSRLTYVESNYANGLYGFYKILQKKVIFYSLKFTPIFLIKKFISPLLEKPSATRFFRKIQMDMLMDEAMHRTSGWASLSKFTTTDAGVKNCQMALEIMGQAGLRHDKRTEKLLRDAKLLQIYEGTNQLNRLNVFKCLIAGKNPKVVMFEE
jgi:acyl-CoA dehydrogenase